MKQNKKVASLMIGMGVLAAGAIATQQTNEAQAATTTRKVAYTEGATTVWTSPEVGQKVKRYVLPHQQLEFVASKKVYSTTWLQTTDGGWVPDVYLDTEAATTVAAPVASTTSPVAPVTSSNTTATTAAASAAAGKVTAAYHGGATTVWADPSALQVKGYLSEGQSASYVATRQAGSSTWYQLQNGGWVHSSYVTTGSQATAVVTTPAATTNNTTTTTTATQPVASTPATPSTSTASQTTTVAKPAVTAPAATPAAPAVPSTVLGSVTANYAGGATTVWTDVNASSVKGYIGEGQTVSYVATKTVNGTTWYQIKNGGWINGAYVGTQGATSNASNSSSTNSSSTSSNSSNASTSTSTPSTSTGSNSSSNSSSVTTPVVNKPVVNKPVVNKLVVNKRVVTTPSTPSNGISSAALIAYAKKFRGTPYQWGGKGPATFDCSGFTSYVFNHFGKSIGGWTVPQESAGRVKSVSAAKPGDLIFWGARGNTYHVAIYIGGGQYIAAPSTGDVVKISNISSYFAPSFAVSVPGVY